MSIILTIVIAFLTALLGFAVAYFMSNKVRSAHSVVQAQLEAKTLEAQNLLAEVQALRAQVAEKLTLLATVEANNANLKEQLTVQKSEVEELQKKLTVEFENIANKILKERAAELSASSEKNIGAILNPLGDKIADFKKQVEEGVKWTSYTYYTYKDGACFFLEGNAYIQTTLSSYPANKNVSEDQFYTSLLNVYAKAVSAKN